MKFKEIMLSDIENIVVMYVNTFNSSPWNDEWTIETASKRLRQMINCESSYGIIAYQDEVVCGMILGSEEQFYNGVVFNIKEFCVRNDIRSQGLGSKIIQEFENRLKDKGISRIVLCTLKNDITQGFYEKKGFQICDGMIMMEKEL